MCFIESNETTNSTLNITYNTVTNTSCTNIIYYSSST